MPTHTHTHMQVYRHKLAHMTLGMFKQPFPGAVCWAAQGLAGASGWFVSLSHAGREPLKVCFGFQRDTLWTPEFLAMVCTLLHPLDPHPWNVWHRRMLSHRWEHKHAYVQREGVLFQKAHYTYGMVIVPGISQFLLNLEPLMGWWQVSRKNQLDKFYSDKMTMWKYRFNYSITI